MPERLADAAGDVDVLHDHLVDEGYCSVRAPFRLDPARARTALVAPPSLDWLVQVIAYDPGAPEAPAPGNGT